MSTNLNTSNVNVNHKTGELEPIEDKFKYI